MTLQRCRKIVAALTAFTASVLVVGAPPSLAGPTGAVAPAAALAPPTFQHPGVHVSRAQLDFVRGKVQAGAQPWKAAYDQMNNHGLASLSRNPKPRAIVECGPVSNPNNGCTDERQDAIAAYTNALNWYITRDQRYANKAIQIMDAWSATIRDHTNSNAPLQTGWSGASWTRAAEIIRHTGAGWSQAGVDRFATMLRNVYLPKVINGHATSNGNWELVMMEASVGIAVFLEDKAVYDRAVTKFRQRVPAFIYLTSDGAYPKGPVGSGIDTREEIIRHWHNQTTFVDGLSQETCRDFTHTGYGIASIASVAETTRHQGQDLYPEIGDRLRHAMGLHARYDLGEAA
ncbi:alginate lyase family protein, partial [Crossiella equi]